MSTVKPFSLSVPWYVRRNVPQGIWTRDDGQETPQGMICSRDKTKSISVKPSVCLFLKSCNLFKTKRLRCLGVVAIKLLHTALLEFAAVQQDWTTKWGNVRLLQQVLTQWVSWAECSSLGLTEKEICTSLNSPLWPVGFHWTLIVNKLRHQKTVWIFMPLLQTATVCCSGWQAVRA